jgi:hypothetical protein
VRVRPKPAIDVVAVWDDTIVAVKRCQHRPRIARALAAHILDDRRALPYLAASLVAHLAIVMLLVLAPGDGGGIDVDLGSNEAVSTPGNLPLPISLAPGPDESPDNEKPGAGGGMKLSDEGTTGKPESSQERGHIRIARRDDTRQVTREQALAEARESGILGSAALSQADFQPLVGHMNYSSGFDDASVLGGLYGGQGESNGSFGFGRSGFGPGCDASCEGQGIIGVGRYGTIGNGRATGEGWGGGVGAGNGGMRGRLAGVPTVVICGYNPTTGQSCVVGEGGLDKAVIRRYIRRQLDKVRYCYEKELLAHPELAGTIATEFLIEPDGTVSSSTAHGISDAVDSCVADVMSHIVFPAAQTHMPTSVHYPFTFRAP